MTTSTDLKSATGSESGVGWGTYANKALIASIVGFVLDGFDLQLIVFILVPLSAELHFTTIDTGSIVTWTLLGAVVGGIVFGILGDYLGRVRVMAWSIGIFAVFTGLCAFAQNYWQLALFRGIAGFGLGSEFGVGMALVTEAWPKERRARATSYVAISWQLGILMAALSAAALLPYIGWRGMFGVGIFPAFVAILIRVTLGEPKIFLEKQHTRRKFPVGLLFKDLQTSQRSLALVFMCFVQNFCYYGVLIWLPFYLSSRFGFSVTRSSLWTAVTIVGFISGMVLFGELADRIGRRPSFFIFQAGAAISVVAYSQLSTPTTLLIGGAIMGIFVNGMLGGYGTLMSELYPTEARATAENVLYNMGRAFGSLGPLVIGILVSKYSFLVGTMFLAGLYILDLIVTYAFIPERRGKALE